MDGEGGRSAHGDGSGGTGEGGSGGRRSRTNDGEGVGDGLGRDGEGVWRGTWSDAETETARNCSHWNIVCDAPAIRPPPMPIVPIPIVKRSIRCCEAERRIE